METDLFDLTIEQQFECRRVQDAVKDVSREQAIELFMEAYRSLMIKDNIFRGLIKSSSVPTEELIVDFLDKHLKYRTGILSIAIFDAVPTKDMLAIAASVFANWLPSQSVTGMIVFAVGKSESKAVMVSISMGNSFHDATGRSLESFLARGIASIKGQEELSSLANACNNTPLLP